MDDSPFTVFAVLLVALGLFIWGRWRHDVVALAILIVSVLLGMVPTEQAFDGFSHPAVVTVACVLILGHALQRTGVVDLVAHRLLPSDAPATLMIAALVGIGALLSSVMNNVGALALLMPVALQTAQRKGLAPGKLLMPLSFATILGGMITLIGTPSNLIVSGFRKAHTGEGFSMFDFTPVGASVAVAGVVFLALIGWRLVPARPRAGVETFNTAAYLTEARVAEEARAVNMTLREAEATLDENDAQIIGLIRNTIRLIAPYPTTRLLPNDILLIEADPDALSVTLDKLGLVFEEERRGEEKPEKTSRKDNEKAERTSPQEAEQQKDTTEQTDTAEKNDTGVLEESELTELVILPGSSLAGRSARTISLRKGFGINLLAISRQGERIASRVRDTPLRHGDVLLVQGTPELVAEFAFAKGCAPLAARELRIPDRKKMIMASAIMGLAIALAASKLLEPAIAFASGVLLVMLTRVTPLRNIYHAVDWSIIVLLGALLPIAHAMETSGAAQLIATTLIDTLAQGHAVLALILMMWVTMNLSDLINNAATAAIMSPIALSTANRLDASIEPFLMAVAVGASCAFLTPIGHQNNTLILGPGGFRFKDYWPLGLPLEALVLTLGSILILWVWPL